MAFKTTPLKSPTVKRVSVANWLNGTVTDNDDGRTPIKGLKSSGNVWLQQDGVVRPRPSLTKYGPQPTGTILGEIFEARVVSGLTSTNYWICLQNVSGTVKAYYAKPEDTSWTACTGSVTYSTSANGRFKQLQNKVLVMTGQDNLSYIDLTTFAVTQGTALSNPSAPTLGTNTGLVGSTFNVYYAITANSKFGQTAGSTPLTQPVSTDRDFWNSSTQSIKINWSAVTGAESYNVYVGQTSGSTGTPTLYLIASGLDASILTYTDNGTAQQDLTNPLPTYNSTAGPKVSRGEIINGRAWLLGDKDNPYYVWRGGDFGHELDFSPAFGGGFTPVGYGAKEIPSAITLLPKGSGGGSQILVLTQGNNGIGKRYTLTQSSATYGSTTITFWDVEEDNGKAGTDSPDALIVYNDEAYYPSRDGFKTTGIKPQLQTFLSTDRISNTIQRDISTLTASAMKNAVGLGWEGRLYFALPVNSSTNNEIWILDLDRKGAWMKPWSISASWMFLASDNSTNTTHFMVLSNNVIYELSYIATTADNNVAFSTSGNSGQIKFSDDGRIWGKLLQLIFVVLRPQGRIDFTVSGKTEDSSLAVVGTDTFESKSTYAGWSEAGAGWSRLRGWSEIVSVPVSFNDSTQEIAVEVDEELQWFSYGWSTTGAGVDYALSDVIAEYVEIGIKDLS